MKLFCLPAILLFFLLQFFHSVTYSQVNDCGNNAGFENGTTSGWTCKYGSYGSGPCPSGSCPAFIMLLNNSSCLNPGGINAPLTSANDRHTIVTGSGMDPNSNNTVPVVAPGGGTYSFRLGNDNTGGTIDGYAQAEAIRFTFTVTSANAAFTYRYAAFLQDPGHRPEEQPRFEIAVLDYRDSLIPCGYYKVVAGGSTGCPGTSNFSIGFNGYKYTNWTSVGLDLTSYIGQNVSIEFRTADCYPGNTPNACHNNGPGSHSAYAYIDVYCQPLIISAPNFCIGSSSIQICAPAGYSSYSWPAGQSGITGSPTTQCVTVNNPVAGTVYNVNMVSVTGCPVSTTVALQQTDVQVKDTMLCSGTGNITLMATPSPPGTYTYSWTGPGGFASTLQNPSVSIPNQTSAYTITATSSLGCSATRTMTVTISPKPTVTVSPNSTICQGSSTILSASGGTAYSWIPSSGLSNSTINNPVATPSQTTTYTVTVTNLSGCQNTGSTTVTVNPLPVATVNPSLAICFGSNTQLSASGGITYLWSPSTGLSNANIFNPIATPTSTTSYTVVVTDANSCTATASVTITEAPAIVLSATSTPTSCNPPSGTATVSSTGGTMPYAYQWSNGQTSSTATGLLSSTYTVTVRDNNGCTGTVSAAVTQFSGVSASIPTASNITCNGQCNGIASALASGGTSPYSYSWNNGQTSVNSSGLCAASYKVTITDANNCTSSATVVITQPAALSTSATHTGIACNGGSNASASVNATGGTVPYSYLWNNALTTTNATGLSAGTYTVTVTDANGCKSIQTVSITQPSSLSSSTSSAPVTCNGSNNGNATANPAGGTMPYLYIWSNGKTTSSVTGLAGGSYSVIVTDGNGCSSTAAISVSEPTAIVLSAASTPTGCNPPSGTATVTSSGATPPYTYLWNNGQTNSTATGLLSGTYSVTVRDNNGCSKYVSIAVTQFSGVTAAIQSSTNIFCNGQCNGSASALASGGTSPYSYSWSNGQTSIISSGLCAGNYLITITDSNNCASFASITITEPSILTDSILKTDVLCNNANDGIATLIINGGTTPYLYAWNNAQTNSSISNLSGGVYSVTVVDANSCSISTSVTITEPAALTLTTFSVPTGCNPPNGTATVSTSGGIAPYAYLWNNGQTSSTATGLVSGTYTVTINDKNNCIKIASITVTQFSGVTAVIQNSSDVSCNGQCDGSAVASTIGGTYPYSYSWNSGQTTTNSNNLCAGAYSVTITDANNCISFSTVIISEPLSISLSLSSTQTSCSPLNGTASVTALGGTSPYIYTWNNNQTNSTASGLDVGTYSVTITDKNNCTTSGTTIVTKVNGASANITGYTDVTCQGQCNGTAMAAGTGGTTPYLYTWSNGQSSDTTSGLCSGTYSVTVNDANNCISVTSILITEPSSLNIISTNSPALCNGTNSGGASVSVTGGNAPYTYYWSNGETNFIATGLVAGSYHVTVTDGNGCFSLASLTITEPQKISLSASSTPTACSQSSGTATVSASGGTAPYFYLWSDGQTTFTATALNSGIYSVTISDSNNCTDTISVFINNLGGPLLNITSLKDVTCNGWSDGSATVTATGISPFTFVWSPSGGTSATATGLNAGTYSAKVTDANGCVSSQFATITEPPPIILNFKRNYYVCAEGTGGVQLTSSGGTTYSWSPSAGLNNPNIANPVATVFTNITYTVTVSNGLCSDTAHINIYLVPPPAQPAISQIGDSLFTSASYSNYQWYYQGVPISGASNFYYIATQTGNYSVFVTDSSGCRVLSQNINVIILSVNSSTVATNNQIKVYPNPTSQTFIILFPQSEKKEGVVTITDIIGRKVYQQQMENDTQMLIDASPFASGLYFIQFTTCDKSQITKIVKE